SADIAELRLERRYSRRRRLELLVERAESGLELVPFAEEFLDSSPRGAADLRELAERPAVLFLLISQHVYTTPGALDPLPRFVQPPVHIRDSGFGARVDDAELRLLVPRRLPLALEAREGGAAGLPRIVQRL